MAAITTLDTVQRVLEEVIMLLCYSHALAN